MLNLIHLYYNEVDQFPYGSYKYFSTDILDYQLMTTHSLHISLREKKMNQETNSRITEYFTVTRKEQKLTKLSTINETNREFTDTSVQETNFQPLAPPIKTH